MKKVRNQIIREINRIDLSEYREASEREDYIIFTSSGEFLAYTELGVQTPYALGLKLNKEHKTKSWLIEQFISEFNKMINN